jgi:hypothetical protein
MGIKVMNVGSYIRDLRVKKEMPLRKLQNKP